MAPSRPAVSVVVARTGRGSLRPLLDRVLPQLDAVEGELVIALTVGAAVSELDNLPRVRVVPVHTRSPFHLRAVAIDEAGGELVMVTEDHVVPDASWVTECVAAYRSSRADLLAGPVANGSTGTRVDWANYLISFSAWAPPLTEMPRDRCPTPANVAIAVDRLRSVYDRPLIPSLLERGIVPNWFLEGRTHLVPTAGVTHVQPHRWWKHVLNHFTNARHSGSYAETRGSWRAFTPSALARASRLYLRNTGTAVASRVDLHEPHRRARQWLRALALVTAVGHAWGARWGQGNSAQHLE